MGSNLAQKYFDQGIDFYKKGKLNKALEFFDKSLTIDPKNVKAFNGKGNVHLDRKDYDRALKYYDKALKLNPEYADAIVTKGNIYFNKNDYVTALEFYNKALEIDSKNFFALNNKGMVLFNFKKYKDAKKCFKKVIKLDPNYLNALFYQGIVFYNLQEYDKALNHFNKALNIEPKNLDILNYIGLIYSNKNDYKNALKFHDKSLKIDPDYPYGFYNKGVIYFELNDFKKARKWFKGAINDEILKSDTLVYLGHMEKNPQESIKYYNKALKVDSHNIYTLYAKGRILRVIKRYDESLKIFDKILMNNPNDGYALCEKMRVFKNLNRINEAKDLEKKLSNPAIKRICLEKHLEDKLENDLAILLPFGYDLELVQRQKGVRGGKGRIDLFCKDKLNNKYIVIELKNVMADKSVFEQIMNYVLSIEEIQGKKLSGLVISRGCNEEFKDLIEKSNNINYLDLKDLGFD